ncbi:ATP F0F1 synthase subunit I [Exilibacterium tricleocarpae]|uniref:ATP F0F1 synthase subunit I n=1 Tax=Exilibacterium tricleocarpae TaxID=2591008 RepID=A0A545TZR4_9GAMM|nr:ATP synthase subunit I [Exilibacterium tricleocarpae]TQV82706.1 ATP F0F1 synthase subunit I [Exilibacterium tricleocarpae]
MASIHKPPVFRVPLVQLAVLLPLCLVAWLFDQTTAYSLLLGGLICVIPNAYFASYAFRYTGARAAPLIARAFFWGETGKFLLTIVGFGAVFLLVKPLDVLALFSAYGVMVPVQWIVTARLVKR